MEFGIHASKAGLKAVVFEYQDDLFVSTNFDKVSLAKMRLRLSTDRWHSRKIIDLGGGAEKQPLRKLKTIWGEPLVAFHHRLLAQVLPDVSAHDGSSWYARRGHHPSSRYLAVMALFIRHGILFENFLTSEREREFTETIILPAFYAAQERFGLRPLIVPIVGQNERDRMWWGYKNEVSVLLSANILDSKIHSEEIAMHHKSTYPRARYEIKPSKIIPGQVGLFALMRFNRGDVVVESSNWDESRLVTWAELEMLDSATRGKLIDFCYKTEEGVHAPQDINRINVGYFMNHSCDPCIRPNENGDFVATRDIQPGEELTQDIEALMKTPRFEFKCSCGTTNCRKIVRR